jgi:hypothetical protein
LTRVAPPGYRMGMVGRSAIGSRLVVLVTVAATLLASWVPLARACACTAAPASGAVTAEPGPAAVCPCCGQRPSPDKPARACCPAPAKADPPGGTKRCGCGPVSRPADPAPTAPPRPADSSDSPVPAVAGIAPAAGIAPMPAGPTTAERAAQAADPPPTDLVTSLSRLTC